jgi:hypothetical protein
MGSGRTTSHQSSDYKLYRTLVAGVMVAHRPIRRGSGSSPHYLFLSRMKDISDTLDKSVKYSGCG